MSYSVIYTAPNYSLSGVNTSTAFLLKELSRRGLTTRILLTNQNCGYSYPLPIPEGITVDYLSESLGAPISERWRLLVEYLENCAPCIYLPGYDRDFSCVCPTLSDHVCIVGILHSDEPYHYEHLERLGRYWNRIICVSPQISDRATRIAPDLASRISTIPYGIPLGPQVEKVAMPDAPLKIVYSGRLIEYQKRVLDLPKIVKGLVNTNVPFVLTIVGDGPERSLMTELMSHEIERGFVRFLGTIPNEILLENLTHQDVIILTSEFEGLPITLLEAMSKGCIPVVSDIRSGVPNLVKDGVNGFCIKVGEIKQFVRQLSRLQQDIHLRNSMSAQSRESIVRGGYNIQDIAARYHLLFDEVIQAAQSGQQTRPKGELVSPPLLHIPAYQLALARQELKMMQERYSFLKRSKIIHLIQWITKNPTLMIIVTYFLTLIVHTRICMKNIFSLPPKDSREHPQKRL